MFNISNYVKKQYKCKHCGRDVRTNTTPFIEVRERHRFIKRLPMYRYWLGTVKRFCNYVCLLDYTTKQLDIKSGE